MTKFKPKDFIAVLVVCSYVLLKIYGLDFQIDGPMGIVLGFYFAHRYQGSDVGH